MAEPYDGKDAKRRRFVRLEVLTDRLENEIGLTLVDAVRAVSVVMQECEKAGLFASFDQQDAVPHNDFNGMHVKEFCAACIESSDQEPTCGLVCKYGDPNCPGGKLCLQPFDEERLP